MALLIRREPYCNPIVSGEWRSIWPEVGKHTAADCQVCLLRDCTTGRRSSWMHTFEQLSTTKLVDICSAYASIQDIQPILAAQWPGMINFFLGSGVELQQLLMAFIIALENNAWPLQNVHMSSKFKALDTNSTLRLPQGNFA